MIIRTICLAMLLGVALVGCERQPQFSLGPVTRDCAESSCTVTFDVTSTSDSTLPVTYEISLYDDYIRGPSKSGLVVVGATNGSIELPSRETRVVKATIEVTDTPKGSQISVFDSRTPKFILEILGS